MTMSESTFCAHNTLQVDPDGVARWSNSVQILDLANNTEFGRRHDPSCCSFNYALLIITTVPVNMTLLNDMEIQVAPTLKNATFKNP